MDSLLPCHYRISVKGLLLDETRTRFLLVQEDNGKWELPGGGLDHGETPHDCLRREIREEMGLLVSWMPKLRRFSYPVKKTLRSVHGSLTCCMKSNWRI